LIIYKLIFIIKTLISCITIFRRNYMSKYLNISILNNKNNLVSNFVEDFGKINKYTYTFSIYE